VTDLTTLRPGRLVAVGGKLYARCARCGNLIRVDKPILGSLHICTAE
jgi:hypothetical protein